MSDQGWKPRSRPAPFYASPKCEHPIEQWHLVNDERWACRACEPQAEAGGALPSADAYHIGPLSAERAITLTKPHVATLPTGERVELPAGTVLREGTGGRAYEPAIIAMREPRPVCCKAAIECSALNWQPLVPSWQMTWGCVQHCPFCGDRLRAPGEDVEPDEPRTLGEQLHDEHDRAAHADGSPCLCDPATTVLADLTERAGLPREMAPSVGPACGCDLPGLACPIHGAPSPDPWLAGLTLAAYNATRAGLDRGTSAKAGVAALMSAYTAGVERAIADHAKART